MKRIYTRLEYGYGQEGHYIFHIINPDSFEDEAKKFNFGGTFFSMRGVCAIFRQLSAVF